MSLYGQVEYWDNRYSKNSQTFDWYQRFCTFKQHVIASIPVKQASKLLVLGCGTSRLPQQLSQQDQSLLCIRRMTEKYKQTQKLKFQQMNVIEMTYDDQSFDGILDKALMDCIMCSKTALDNVSKMINQVYRVLKKKGTYIMISYEKPQKRMHLLKKSHLNWTISVHKIQKSLTNKVSSNIFQDDQQLDQHYVYVCIKE